MSRYSEDEVLLENTITYKSFYRFFFNIVTVCLGSFFFGYGLTYFSAYPIEQIRTAFHIDMGADTLNGILNAIVPAGAFFGAILSSPLLKYLSRRNSLVVVCGVAIIGGGLTLITSLVPLLIGRFIIGLGVGFYSSICPLYINELSPIQLSGIFGTMNQLFIVCGVIVANLLTLVVSNNQDPGAPITSGWRFIFGGTILIGVLQAVLLLTVYKNQTPKYLLLKNRNNEAKDLIQELYLPQYSDLVYEKIMKETNPDYNQSILSSVGADNRRPQNQGNSTIAVIMGFHLSFLQQMSGINVVVLYCGDIFKKVIDNKWIKICRILLQAISLVGCFGATFFIKKLGRKTLLQIGSFSVGIILAVIGICFKIQTEGANTVIVFCLYLYMLMFGFTLGPIVWMYIPQVIKAKWVPFTTMTNWAGCMITVLLFPIIQSAMGTPLYIFFFLAAWCLGSGAVNHFFLVESKGKTMAEISIQYQSKFK